MYSLKKSQEVQPTKSTCLRQRGTFL